MPSIKLQNYKTPKFTYPYVVKPSNEGSTYGLSIVHAESELSKSIGYAAEYSDEILIEEYISGRELTVGILGNKSLPIIEIKPSHNFFDFEYGFYWMKIETPSGDLFGDDGTLWANMSLSKQFFNQSTGPEAARNCWPKALC